MRRRRSAQTTLTPSLFPFLAVLICTMGALIALLVLGVQQAHVHAEVVVQQQESRTKEQEQREEEERLKREDFIWQQEILEEQRTKKTSQLADRRLQLSHLEEHLRQLQGEWERAQEKMRQLRQSGEQRQNQSKDWQQQLTDLEQQIKQAQEQLDVLRQQAGNADKGYAVVVYSGSRGTKRRPIYLECTAAGILIHPGGVQISRDDLDGPGGPGNPLDACLRAIREYLAEQGTTEEEPYPLLLVRPDAVYTYARAREAMKSWEDEFGYELIEDNVPLKFSPPDENLKTILLQTIQDARQRQISLSRAMPSRFAERAGEQYRPANSHRRPKSPLSPGANASGRGFGDGQSGAAGRDPALQQGTSGKPGTASTKNQPGADQEAEGDGTPQAFAGSDGEGGTAIAPGNRKGGWGLPKRRFGSTGISRPVRVICTTDRLIIVPGRYERLNPFTTPTGGNVAGSLDRFVGSLWDYMENWGIAVAGGYWKPVLNVEVRPGADSHFEQLKTLLASSGIEVKRK